MATRQYCDHCGNTVRNPKQFCYGPYPAVNYVQAYVGQQQYAAGSTGILGASAYPTAIPSPEMVVIDLCDHCIPVWTKRVEMLTKASDVQAD